MSECKCCGATVPDGTSTCPNCLVYCGEPPAKFEPGALVKMRNYKDGMTYYNYIGDSYFNKEINMRMYRMNEAMPFPIYREDWLEAVSDDEIDAVNKTGLLEPRAIGGWLHPALAEGDVVTGPIDLTGGLQ